MPAVETANALVLDLDLQEAVTVFAEVSRWDAMKRRHSWVRVASAPVLDQMTTAAPYALYAPITLTPLEARSLQNLLRLSLRFPEAGAGRSEAVKTVAARLLRMLPPKVQREEEAGWPSNMSLLS